MSLEKIRYFSRWITISCVAIFIVVCAVGYCNLGIDFHFEGPSAEGHSLEREIERRENENAYDRTRDYYSDPEHNREPSHKDNERAYEHFTSGA